MTAAAGALALAGCGEASGSPSVEAEGPKVSAIGLLSVEDLRSLIDEDKVFLVDVRTPEEFAGGHIAGAVNIPVEEFDPAAIEVPTGKLAVLYCRSGRRSKDAATRFARQRGMVSHLEHGILAWEEAGQPVEE